MKFKILALLTALAIIYSCSENPQNKYNGTWKVVETKWAFNDSMQLCYPGNIKSLDGSWIIADNYAIYLFKYQIEGDTTDYVDYGKTKVKFENNTVTENYLISNEKNLVGQTLTFEVEEKGDSLIFRGPTENGKDAMGYVIYEVFVRE